MLTDIYDIQAYAKTLCKHAKTADGKNFQVKFTNEKAPCTRVTPTTIEIHLPKLNSSMTDRDVVMSRWFMIHEISHHTEGKDIFKIMQENALDPMKSPLGGLLNCFEDGRIEKSSASKYQGDAQVFSNALDLMVKESLEQFKTTPFPEDPELQKMGACIVAEMEARSDWNYGAANNYHDYAEALPPIGKEALKKLRDAGMVDVLRNLGSEYDALEAAKKAYELVWEKDPDEHIEEQKKQQQEQEGEGDGSGDTGEGDSEEGEGEGQGERVNEVEDSGRTVNYLDLLNSKHSMDMGEGASASGVTLDYTEYMDNPWDGDYYEPCKLEDVRVARFHIKKYSHANVSTALERYAEGHSHYNIKQKLENLHKQHGEPSKGFGNKVRRHLQVLSQSRYVGGHKKGKLHRKSAFKIGVPQVGNGEWNSRVFRQKHTQDVLDVAVCVLTDFSGSMYGQHKVAHAIDSTMLLNESIGTSLHIPLQILTFTETGGNCFIGVVKDYDERVSDEEVKEGMFKSGAFMSGNPDGDAVMWAYSHLKGRKEKRKILIVLSDGSPASSRPGDDMAFVQKVVKEIEEEGVIEIVGLGIKDRNVEYIYSQNETIQEASELENAVLNLVKKQIIK